MEVEIMPELCYKLLCDFTTQRSGGILDMRLLYFALLLLQTNPNAYSALQA